MRFFILLWSLFSCLYQTTSCSRATAPAQALVDRASGLSTTKTATDGKSSLLNSLQPQGLWLGWNNTEKMFVFGDSYTTTYFDVTGEQPKEHQPLGNPPYPGVTSSNGPNWVDYLTTTYNKSMIDTYNMAVGGATVYADLIPPTLNSVDFFHQVTKEWMPSYGRMSAVQWTPTNSLFAIFFGINDVDNSYKMGVSSMNQDALKIYRGLIDALYTVGARNFLFLNVPPIQRSPLTAEQGEGTVAIQRNAVIDFNKGLDVMVMNFSVACPGTTVFRLNTYDLFMEVLDNPNSYPQTAIYRNTTTFCAAYQKGTINPDTLNTSCGVPANQYFWLNSLHPTSPVHDLMAVKITGLFV